MTPPKFARKKAYGRMEPWAGAITSDYLGALMGAFVEGTTAGIDAGPSRGHCVSVAGQLVVPAGHCVVVAGQFVVPAGH